MKSNTGNYPDSPSKRQLKKANKQELKRIKNLDGFEDIASNIGGGLGNNI